VLWWLQELGFMAQDIEQEFPEAVAECGVFADFEHAGGGHNGGILHVDKDRLFMTAVGALQQMSSELVSNLSTTYRVLLGYTMDTVADSLRPQLIM